MSYDSLGVTGRKASLSACLPDGRSAYLSTCLSTCLLVFWFYFGLSASPSVRPSVRPSGYLTTSLSLYLSVSLPSYLSLSYLSVSLAVRDYLCVLLWQSVGVSVRSGTLFCVSLSIDASASKRTAGAHCARTCLDCFA